MSVRFNKVTDSWRVSEARTAEDGSEYYVVEVGEKKFCECSCRNCRAFEMVYRDHTSGTQFEEHSAASEWIEEMADAYEEQMERYEEENSYAIAQMERYEMWRNEY